MKRIPVILSCLFCGMSLAAAVAPPQPSGDFEGADSAASKTTTIPTVRLPANPDADLPVQRVGPDDLLTLSVANSPELSRNFRVSADGTLVLPMLKQHIPVAGKTTPEIEKAISDELVNEQVLVEPVVSVMVAEYRSVPVSVSGAVRNPVTFQAVGQVRLLDALTKAGGLTQNAGPDILITRPRLAQVDPSQSFAQRIPVKELLTDANPEANVRLYGGEEIRVPQAGRVYALGNVRHPGAFPLLDNEDLTVMKLIAESEGLMPYSRKVAFIYRLKPGMSSRDEIPVELHAILERKAPDVPLMANDIFYVPDAKGRRITAQTLDRMVSFGVGTASGFLIFH
jgi:polysaccharide biosynthesis/export protein